MNSNGVGPHPDRHDQNRVAADEVMAAIGESPETVIALHFLRLGTVNILSTGDPSHLEGIIVQLDELPEEPIAFGESAEAVASLLPHLRGWTCLNVPMLLVDDLIEPVAATAAATSVRLLDDVHFALDSPVPGFLIGEARLLTGADTALIHDAADGLLSGQVDTVLDRIGTGHVAGVVVNGVLVSLAMTFATTARFADIGVTTHPAFRGRGFGTNVAACVAAAIQQSGRTPIWSCGATNLPSMAIAARLGCREVSRRVYLIPEWSDDNLA